MTTLTRRRVLEGAVGALLAARATPANAAALARPPVLFVSHGTPLFLPHNEERRAALQRWGASLTAPRGIVVMTPHVASRELAVGPTGPGFAMYDLPALFKRQLPQDLEYATPPSEALARRLDQLLGDGRPATRSTSRGFDHTTWMPLRCLFPAAQVPVVELAYPYLSEAKQLTFGQKLAPLRDEGILFVGSAGMTHNLAMMGDGEEAGTPTWANEFDLWAAERLARLDVDALVDWRHKAPAALLAHPDDGAHFRVLLVALGMLLGGGSASAPVSFPVTGFERSMSRRCAQLG